MYDCFLWEAVFRRHIDKLKPNDHKVQAYIESTIYQMFADKNAFYINWW